MAFPSPIQAVEAFHLVFLRMLEAKLDRSCYVVKDGVNLRAWFGSQRCSEDLGLDVLRGESWELREKVGALLRSSTFDRMLRTQQVSVARATTPKQTETTRRWKIRLTAEGHAGELPTKIEFSRRGTDEEYALEPARSEIVRPYGIPAPTANHYTAAAAIRQKIEALGGRRATQARDIWDLDHLFRMMRAEPLTVTPAVAGILDTALKRVTELPYEVFKAQVVPYLEAEHQELYGTSDAWEQMQSLVLERLLELEP